MTIDAVSPGVVSRPGGRGHATGSPDDRTPVLRVIGLEKHFVLHHIDGRTVAGLRGVDVEVAAGEHVALVGSSGAGKSSLLRCIYRTYEPSAGVVELIAADGTATELTSLPDRSMALVRGREVGYVTQFLRPQPRRTAFEIVSRAAASRGMARPDAADAAADALRRLRLDETLWDVHATVLSGGEQQRVNLAAGTVSPPRLLLLDEPVSALDPANRAAALELIGGLTDVGTAVLAVFHDLDAIEQLATRAVVMADGRVVDDGPPDRILPALTGVAR